MGQELKTESDCRLVYADIVNGYSCDASGKFFIQHFGELDSAETERKRRLFLKEQEQAGVLREKDKLALLAANGHWTEEDEAAYRQHMEDIDGLRESLRKLVIPQQIEHMEGMIKDKQKENIEKWITRAQLLGTTSENFASRRAAEFHIMRSFCTDSSLKERRFLQEEIDNMSNEEIEAFTQIYTSVSEVFTDKNFKRIAVCPFFMNSYMISDGNSYSFFGKPIISLTTYQLVLFNRASYYKEVVSEASQRPPDDYYDDLDKVLQFYDRQYSIILGKRSNNQLMR